MMCAESRRESPAQESLGDEALVVRAQSGDKKAFESLVLRHQSKILNLCFRLIGRTQASEDLAADIFAEAFRSLKQFQRKSKFGTWLYRIALNLSYRHLKILARERALFVPSESTEEEETISELPSREPNPEERLRAQETIGQVRRVLLELSRDQAQILILHDVESCSYAEVSEILRCPIGTVMSRISRAREAFRRKWNQLCQG
jgi:RNA polymerase sigma-70 factor (ECF subfamily)